MKQEQKEEIYNLVFDALSLKPGVSEKLFNENLVIHVTGAQGSFLLFHSPEVTIVSRGSRTRFGLVVPSTNILRAFRWMWSHRFEVVETTWFQVYGLLLGHRADELAEKEAGGSEPNL